jgi:hypothetical protein
LSVQSSNSKQAPLIRAVNSAHAEALNSNRRSTQFGRLLASLTLSRTIHDVCLENNIR